MEKPMTSYETMFIVDASNGVDSAKDLVKKFTDLIAANGAVSKIIDLGLKKLAYEINDMSEGYYTLVYFDAKQDFPAELSRVFNITDGVMRSLIIADSKAPADDVIPNIPSAIPDEEPEEAEKPVEEPAAESAEAEETAEATENTEETVEEVKEAAEAVEKAAEEPANDAE